MLLPNLCNFFFLLILLTKMSLFNNCNNWHATNIEVYAYLGQKNIVKIVHDKIILELFKPWRGIYLYTTSQRHHLIQATPPLKISWCALLPVNHIKRICIQSENFHGVWILENFKVKREVTWTGSNVFNSCS